jgi:hypothetical protein
LPKTRACARILPYANANLLLTESFHGNIEKVGWAQIGRQQPLPFAHLGRTLQLRKEIIGTWFFGEKVVGTGRRRPEINGEKVVTPRLNRTEIIQQEIVGA